MRPRSTNRVFVSRGWQGARLPGIGADLPTGQRAHAEESTDRETSVGMAHADLAHIKLGAKSTTGCQRMSCLTRAARPPAPFRRSVRSRMDSVRPDAGVTREP